MSLSKRRVGAIFRKELREYRRNGVIIGSMAVIPLIVVVFPLIEVLALPASSSSALRNGNLLAFLLDIPAVVPSIVAAYLVVGERQQGTIELVLTTPIPREEFLLAKALAALLPSLVISLAVCAAFIACVELFAQPGVASAVVSGPDLLAQVLFTPLLATWAIWLAMAFSARSNDVRVAQSLGTLACLPTVVVTNFISIGAVHATLGLAVVLGVALVLIDVLGWRFVSAMFDRERLITGTR